MIHKTSEGRYVNVKTGKTLRSDIFTRSAYKLQMRGLKRKANKYRKTEEHNLKESAKFHQKRVKRDLKLAKSSQKQEEYASRARLSFAKAQAIKHEMRYKHLKKQKRDNSFGMKLMRSAGNGLLDWIVGTPQAKRRKYRR